MCKQVFRYLGKGTKTLRLGNPNLAFASEKILKPQLSS